MINTPIQSLGLLMDEVARQRISMLAFDIKPTHLILSNDLYKMLVDNVLSLDKNVDEDNGAILMNLTIAVSTASTQLIKVA